MYQASKYSYPTLSSITNGKVVHFISDCEMFPNFDITGKVMSVSYNNSETIFKVKIRGKEKTIHIGSNMKNLQFEILS